MDTEFLEECGLTRGESRVYISLLELGSVSAGQIIKKTGLQRSAVYFCLDSLLGKGLVSYILKNNTKYFEAENPEKIYELIERKMERLQSSKNRMAAHILELQTRKKELPEEAKIFKGWNGARSAFDDMLRSLKRDEDWYIFGVITQEEAFPRFRRFMAKINQKRVAIGFRINAIMNERLMGTLGADREKEPKAFIKYLPKEFQTPTVTYIYKNKVIFAIWKREPVVFVIESEDAAKSFKRYFDLLWSIAKTRREVEKEKTGPKSEKIPHRKK